MCGRVIQSSGPLRYAIVDGMKLRDSRVHDYPTRWNAVLSIAAKLAREDRFGSNLVIPVMSAARPLFPRKRTSICDLAMSAFVPRPDSCTAQSTRIDRLIQ
jgi:hypothetical protein